jgi:hypothetical protein
VTASGKKYKNAARWYCRHSRYQARSKTSTDLLLSDHRPRRSESASPVIAGQHSSTDRPHRYHCMGRLPSCCPPKPASDHQKNLSGTSARSPAAATRIVWPAIPQPLPDKSAYSGWSSQTFLEVHKRPFSGPPNLNCADNRRTAVISASGCLECTDIPHYKIIYFMQCDSFNVIKTPDDGPLRLKHVVRRSEISYF